MTQIRIDDLIWDEWNIKHVEKHSLSKNKVEKAIRKIKSHRYGYKGRVILICKLGEKSVSVIVDKKTDGKYYVVTARSSDRKERKLI